MVLQELEEKLLYQMVRQFCQFNNFEYEIDELEKKVSVIRAPHILLDLIP